MAKKRTKIPPNIEANVMYKSHLMCCICQEKGDHIHHLDGKPNNNHIDNLVLLCFKHHELASIKGNIGKKLSKETILMYRHSHYISIEKKRQSTQSNIDTSMKGLTEASLLKAMKNALIILELENIKQRYYEAELKNKNDILNELYKYSNHNNTRLTYEIFNFLEQVIGQPRGGMNAEMASSVFLLILEFSHTLNEKSKRADDILKIALYIGDNIVYDSIIYLKNLKITMYGLTIIKHVYTKAKILKSTKLKEAVLDAYKEIDRNLKRPDRTDLISATELVNIFKEDIDHHSLSFPPLPDELARIVYSKN